MFMVTWTKYMLQRSITRRINITRHILRKISLRLAEQDLYRLKSNTVEEGIPYQTLAASIIHKYTQGRLS